MKKLLLILLLVVGFYGSASAQGFFVRVGGGYNFSFAGDVIGYNRTSNQNDEVVSNKGESVMGSFSQGINCGIHVGFLFNKHIGADLGFNYIFGTAYQYGDMQIVHRSWGPVTTLENVIKVRANTFLITPSIILSTDPQKMISVYTRFGLAIGMPSLITQETLTQIASQTTSTDPIYTKIETEKESNFTIGVGISGAVGLDIHLGKKLGVYGEINFVSLTAKLNSTEITKMTRDGKNILSDQHPNTTKYKTVDNIQNENSVSGISTYNPNQLRTTTTPFSSLGFNIGIKLRF